MSKHAKFRDPSGGLLDLFRKTPLGMHHVRRAVDPLVWGWLPSSYVSTCAALVDIPRSSEPVDDRVRVIEWPEGVRELVAGDGKALVVDGAVVATTFGVTGRNEYNRALLAALEARGGVYDETGWAVEPTEYEVALADQIRIDAATVTRLAEYPPPPATARVSDFPPPETQSTLPAPRSARTHVNGAAQ